MKTMKLSVRNTQTGNSALMEVDNSTKLQEVLDSAVEFWELPDEPYLMKVGKKLVSASKTVSEASLNDGDTIDLLPDPEGGQWQSL
ncbi:MAG: hypothetical protein M1422_04990 [Candidatus Thermoplasmatota archaeon]|jgi:hypothetical protein|nr:hypothetical protein [Candidatus Sysuiplasma jiujiangense]MBX8639400.1 hypothetical protein [Candidatus Sysuiplasma jiujiangense]MBX8642378.1 hypothetical protein [Candidatus Sysuiplasma jiujiangense]MCL4317608.1 hypothetical protein [Candidatus Thermoplasmatota archaeon]